MAKRRKTSGAGGPEVAVADLKNKPCWTIIATGLPDIDAAREWSRNTLVPARLHRDRHTDSVPAGNCTAIKTCRLARR